MTDDALDIEAQAGKHTAEVLRAAAGAARTVREEAAREAERLRAAAEQELETARACADLTIEEARSQASVILADAEQERRRQVQEGEQTLRDLSRLADDRAAEAERIELVARERKAAAEDARDASHQAARELIDDARRHAAALLETAREQAEVLLSESRTEAELIVDAARRRAASDEQTAIEVRERLDLAMHQLRVIQARFGLDEGATSEGLPSAETAIDEEADLISLKRSEVPEQRLRALGD